MAKYTAEITNKDLINGELVIQIRYTGEDGTIIHGSARTRDVQDENWASNIIAQKIASLEGLPNFIESITLGEVVIAGEQTPSKTPKEEYLEDYNNFSRLFDLYRKGIIEENNKKLTDLRQKLKDNLNLEYFNIT